MALSESPTSWVVLPTSLNGYDLHVGDGAEAEPPPQGVQARKTGATDSKSHNHHQRRSPETSGTERGAQSTTGH